MMMQERTDIPSLQVTALPPSTKWRVTVGRFSLLALAVLGFFLILLLTPHGIGVSDDSISYIESARNIIAGKGYTFKLPHDQFRAITHWPPLFSYTLSLIGLSGVDIWIAARWLNSFLLAVNIFLTGYLVKQYANGCPIAALLAGILVLVSYDMLNVHRMAWSEPLFISLVLLGFTFVLKHLETPKFWLVLFSAFFMSLAFMTRYFAAPLIGATALSILLLKQGSPWTRFRDAASFSLLVLVPMLCWSIRNMLVPRQTANLQFGYIGFPSSLLGNIANNCASWFVYMPGAVPAGVTGVVRVLVFMLLLYGLFLLVRRTQRNTTTRTLTLFIILHSLCYILFYLFICAFFASDCASAVRRYMTPLYPLGVMILTLAIAEHAKLFQRHRVLMLLGPLLGVMVVTLVAKNSYNRLWRSSQSDGKGAVSRLWMQSETMRAVRDLPHDAFIISNAPQQILFHTGRAAASFPIVYDYHRNNQPFTDYNEQVERLRRQCTNPNCFVIAFAEARKASPYLVAPEKLVTDMGLICVMTCSDGALYKIRQ